MSERLHDDIECLSVYLRPRRSCDEPVGMESAEKYIESSIRGVCMDEGAVY